MLSFGIIASSASTQAGVTNWDFFAPTGDDYSMVAFGTGGTAMLFKPPGANVDIGYTSNITSSITAGQSFSAQNARELEFNNGFFHLMGGNNDTRRILFSTNGTSFGTALNLTAQTGDNMRAITFGGGLWVAPVYGDNDVYTSANGTAFTEQANVLVSALWTDATWNGSVYGVYAGRKYNDTGSTSYYTSTNGTTWTARTLPAIPFSPVTVGSGVAMYVGSSAVVYTSASGTAFAVAGTAPASLWNSNVTEGKLAFGNGVWVYAGRQLSGGTVLSYFSSNNGATWSTATFSSAITASGYDLAFDQSSNSFYMVADAGSTTNVYKASVLS